MRRDLEIKRLVSYITGLGVKVKFSDKASKSAAEWAIDNSEIIIYTKENTSKIETVFSLIHEAGHACHHIWKRDRILDKNLETVLDREDNSKKARYKIYKEEEAAIKFWDTIIIDTNIGIKSNRIEYQKEKDLWHYEFYYKHGKFPNRKEIREKVKKLKQKWRNK